VADIQAWNATDASNVDLWPEGMLGGSINDSGRAMQGVLARWFADINGSLASSGSLNAFTVTSSRTIASLVDGTRLTFRANHSITGAATLNLNTLGAKDIKRFNGSALASGDIISGQPVDVIFSSALDDWIMVSALAALVGSTHADFGENGSPGDPAADTGRLYAKDDGSGTTVVAYRDSAGVESILGGIATQAQMETATSVIKGVAPGRQHFHPGHPKAGGNFNGSGTPAFRSGDYGMGAITDNGVGDYTLAIDTAFNDTNYWCAGWARNSIDSEGLMVSAQTAGTKTASTMSIQTREGGDNLRDSTEVGITFWGDYA
jgi:hypothetical protein